MCGLGHKIQGKRRSLLAAAPAIQFPLHTQKASRGMCTKVEHQRGYAGIELLRKDREMEPCAAINGAENNKVEAPAQSLS